MSNPTVITYDSKYAKNFADLNKEWISKYFVIEPMDSYQLENPDETIISKGGEIFFVCERDDEGGNEGEKVLATCAMVPSETNAYELAKMAVDPAARGKGYGDLLMIAAIDWARAKRADEVLLRSNTVLTPAITLYKKHGFETVFLGPHPDYERCNIEMRRKLR